MNVSVRLDDALAGRLRLSARALCSLLSAASIAVISFAAVTASAHASELPSQCPLASSARGAPESEPTAQADASAMLAELQLPPGSSESSTDPPEAGSLLAGPVYGPPATPNAVDEHAWWLVPVTPTETLTYICAHLPPGATRGLSGGGLMGPNIPENTASGFTWPGSPGMLVVWVVRLANGSTALRVDAEVVWITPRATSERIPAGARLLTISAHKLGRPLIGIRSDRPTILRRLPSRVTSAARIEEIVALLNELRVHQPGLRPCPLELAESVQLSFYASPSAPPLAVADINTAGCGGVSLTIDGMAEPELEGGWYLVEEIGRALGIRPARGAPRPHRRHHRTHL